jgi:hypothetical protein
MVLPFALDGSLKGKICVAVINIVIDLCIASLLSSVLSRTVVDGERSWQPQLLISSWFAANGAGLADVASVHRSGQHWSALVVIDHVRRGRSLAQAYAAWKITAAPKAAAAGT